VECQDWAAPILQRPLELKDGFALPQTEAGCELTWDKDAVEHYASPLAAGIRQQLQSTRRKKVPFSTPPRGTNR